MATKKDEIIQFLLKGKSIDEIIELGNNKKYVKEVLREYNKRQSVKIDEIVDGINNIKLVNKNNENNDIELKKRHLLGIVNLLNSFINNEEYLEYLKIDIKISLDGQKGSNVLNSKKINTINPIDIYRREGREKLNIILESMDIVLLKEIARQYTPDLRGYVYKWNDKNKVVNYILQRTATLSDKGSVFISDEK